MDSRQRDLQSLTMINSDVFAAAGKRLSDTITAKVMHPKTTPQERDELLLEYRVITKMITVIDNWATTAKGETDDA